MQKTNKSSKKKERRERRGIANEDLLLSKFMYYIHSVYGIGGLLRSIRDARKRRTIQTHTVSYVLLFAFVLQMSSFNQLRYYLEENKKRFENLLGKRTRIPKIDAIRDAVRAMEEADVRKAYEQIVDKAIENKAWKDNTINGFRVAAIDGVELFSSELKSCPECLTRTVKGTEQYFHKAVVCMTVGGDPHIALGAEMLHPREDSAEKDEGEQTGAKRLLTKLNRAHHHFADVIVADALYMNAPFINHVKQMRMDVVIRAKDERLNIMKDALGLFGKREADGQFDDMQKVHVDVWDEDGFQMEGCPENIRFLRFKETVARPRGKTEKREVLCITTLPKGVSAHTVWLIMHKRWDIENNGFRMLKTYFHADHCYVHGKDTNEKILLFILMAFTLMELFLFRRLHGFREKKMLRINILRTMFDELLTTSYAQYFKTG